MSTTPPLSAVLLIIAAVIFGFGLFSKPPLDVPLIWLGITLFIVGAIATWAWGKTRAQGSASYDGGSGGSGGDAGGWYDSGDCGGDGCGD